MSDFPDLRAESSDCDDMRLLRFINRIAPLDEPIAHVAQLRDALSELLGDVDRISISMNLQSYDLEHAVTYGHGEAARVVPIVVPHHAVDAPARRLVQEAAQAGFPVDQYHPPSVHTYHAGERTYVGAILLWRQLHRPPISERSLEMMHELRSFLTYRMVECVSRFVRDERIGRGLSAVASQIAARVGLGGDDREILSLALGGMSVGAIAARTGLLATTVQRRITAICHLTGACDVGEIIRRHVGDSEVE